MARIRTIKPEFCSSKDAGALSREARLFFLLLFTEVDDAGRVLWIPRRLCGVLYPHDDDVTADMLTQWCAECAARGMLIRYAVANVDYLQITNWLKHQKISHATDSRLPAPSAVPEVLRTDSGAAPEALRPDLGFDLGIDLGVGSAEKTSAAKKPRRTSAMLLTEWMDTLGDADAIPADDPIFKYSDKTGIPHAFLELSWQWFVDTMTQRAKRQTDWRGHYRRCVSGNWPHMWWFAPDGECKLTAAGEQARRAAA